MPIVADIHFHYKRCIEAAKAGAACLRINPGNIGSADRVREVVKAARDHGCSMRIGVNAGSLEKDLLEKYGEPCPEAMVESALDHARILQDGAGRLMIEDLGSTNGTCLNQAGARIQRAEIRPEDHVFFGPSAVCTNVINPRSEISRRDQFRTTVFRQGATIGANSTIVCGTTIGRYAFVGAGSVVTRDVADYMLVYGNPARPRGWVCRCGVKLEFAGADAARVTCIECGAAYARREQGIEPL